MSDGSFYAAIVQTAGDGFRISKPTDNKEENKE